MKLIVLLLAVAIEHNYRRSGRWGVELSLLQTFNLWCERHPRHWWLVLLVPVGGIYMLTQATNGFLGFVVHLLLVLLAIGCVEERSAFRHFIREAKREDDEACYLIGSNLGVSDEQLRNNFALHLSQRLLLLNFRYYFTPLFYYILLGPAVMTAYALARSYREYRRFNPMHGLEPDVIQQQQIQLDRLLYLFEWLPIRIALLGYDLHTRLHNWSLEQLRRWKGPQSGAEWQLNNFLQFALTEYCEKDFELTPVEGRMNKCLKIVSHFVALARRNNLFFLVLIAILTIYEWLV